MKMTNSRLSSPLAPTPSSVLLMFTHRNDIVLPIIRAWLSPSPLCVDTFLPTCMYPHGGVAALMFMFLYFRSSAVICAIEVLVRGLVHLRINVDCDCTSLLSSLTRMTLTRHTF
jgi:hypothetical protein